MVVNVTISDSLFVFSTVVNIANSNITTLEIISNAISVVVLIYACVTLKDKVGE